MANAKPINKLNKMSIEQNFLDKELARQEEMDYYNFLIDTGHDEI